jgi:hypothetical protein
METTVVRTLDEKEMVTNNGVKVEKKMDLPTKRERLEPLPSHLDGLVEELKTRYHMKGKVAIPFLRWVLETNGQYLDFVSSISLRLDQEKEYAVVKASCEKRQLAWKSYLTSIGFHQSGETFVFSFKHEGQKKQLVVHTSIPTLEQVMKYAIVKVAFLLEELGEDFSIIQETMVSEEDFGRTMTDFMVKYG